MERACPRISIVTPVLNGATTIDRCLDSVAVQHPAVIEHIIVDGGSADGTLERLRRRTATGGGAALRLLGGPDRGIADAWNKGIEASSGEWIGILNADDWYEPDAIVQLLPYMTGVAVVHGRSRLHDSRTGAARESGPLEWFPEKHFRPLQKMPAQHPTCFVPRTVYERVGLYDTNFRLAMDYDFLLRAHLAGIPFRYVPKVITNFSVMGASSRDPRRSQREVLASQVLHLNRLRGPLWNYVQTIRRDFMRRWRRRLLGRKIIN